MEGWVSIHRKIQDNPLWKNEPFTRGQAWVDLIILANHKPGYIIVRDVVIDIDRGQVGWSELKLSARWQWSRTKVRSFLKLLEREQQIKQHKNNISSIITIINYDGYQKKEQQEIQQENSRRTAGRQQEDTNNNDNNENNENNNKRFDPKTVKPAFVSDSQFKEIKIHRTKVKATNTERSWKVFFKELGKAIDEGFTVDKCIDEMSSRSWKGFKCEWMPKDSDYEPQRPKDTAPNFDPSRKKG